ncbi:hypothetical protein SH1V18_39200 [Vallitalea longa]|uniref:N-acetyltransferase domain-containing protein n=1 Tax=Vallitalea longa TaxID=2936439 RepID=A0A9W6DGB0_9FIRM|nr:hypothetical protein [Vallitalea longa]GKX31440.1 hypothetical protein SH1V18_39200 [Vallitalea longa]
MKRSVIYEKKINNYNNAYIEKSPDNYSLVKSTKHMQLFQIYLPLTINQSKNTSLSTQILDRNFKCKIANSNYKDIIEAIKCIYSVYGYRYSYRTFYYPNKFKRLMDKDRIKSYLMINEHGQIGGHAALIKSDSFRLLPEVTMIVVKPAFRGLKLSCLLLDCILEASNGLRINGLCAQPVVFHSISQKIFYDRGFVACGFLFHYLNEEVTELFSKERRLDLALCVKTINKKYVTKIYPPEEHVYFIKNIYRKLSIKCETSRYRIIESSSDFDYSFDNNLGICTIIFDRVGKDISNLIDSVIDECELNKKEMIVMYINMKNPSCNYGYKTAIDKGFIFSGIKPLSDNGDYIIVQHMLNHSIDYDVIKAEYDYKNLLEYIRLFNERN